MATRTHGFKVGRRDSKDKFFVSVHRTKPRLHEIVSTFFSISEQQFAAANNDGSPFIFSNKQFFAPSNAIFVPPFISALISIISALELSRRGYAANRKYLSKAFRQLVKEKLKTLQGSDAFWSTI